MVLTSNQMNSKKNAAHMHVPTYLRDPVRDVGGAISGAEGVDDVAQDEGHERPRHPVGNRRGRAHGHERGVRPVREREQPVQRNGPDGGRLLVRRRRPLTAAGSSLAAPSHGQEL
jgi:hypothetical protein